MGDRRGDVLRGKQKKGPDQSRLLIYLINLFFQDLVSLYFELSCTACQIVWTGDLILAKLSVNVLLNYLSFRILLQVSEEETMRVGTLCTLI